MATPDGKSRKKKKKDWFVLCSVHDTSNTFLYHLLSNALICFANFLFRAYVSYSILV